MNWKAIFKTAAHAAIGGAVVGLAAYDPTKPVTAGSVLLPIAASAASSVFSLYSNSPIGQSILTIAKALLDKKK